jgi:hypothetical protein
MRAAIVSSIRFDAMADDSTAAVTAYWREAVDRTFKAIEHVALTRRHDLERQLVFVSADFTLRHVVLLNLRSPPTQSMQSVILCVLRWIRALELESHLLTAPAAVLGRVAAPVFGTRCSGKRPASRTRKH